jgi:hypothetical protein
VLNFHIKTLNSPQLKRSLRVVSCTQYWCIGVESCLWFDGRACVFVRVSNEKFLVNQRVDVACSLSVFSIDFYVTVFLVSVAKAHDTSPVCGSMWLY